VGYASRLLRIGRRTNGGAGWLRYDAGLVSVSIPELEMLAGSVRETPIIQMMLTKGPTGTGGKLTLGTMRR